MLLLLLVVVSSSLVKTRPSQMLCQSALRRWYSSSFGARCAETNVTGTVSSLSPVNPILAPTAPLLPISYTPTPTLAVSVHWILSFTSDLAYTINAVNPAFRTSKGW